jgi:hypothetical protein
VKNTAVRTASMTIAAEPMLDPNQDGGREIDYSLLHLKKFRCDLDRLIGEEERP